MRIVGWVCLSLDLAIEASTMKQLEGVVSYCEERKIPFQTLVNGEDLEIDGSKTEKLVHLPLL